MTLAEPAAAAASPGHGARFPLAVSVGVIVPFPPTPRYLHHGPGPAQGQTQPLTSLYAGLPSFFRRAGRSNRGNHRSVSRNDVIPLTLPSSISMTMSAHGVYPSPSRAGW